MLRIGRPHETDPESEDVLPVTPDNVKSAKNREKIRSIERSGKIGAWNDYIGFGVSKVLGLSGLIAGGIEYIAPGLSPVALNKPAWVAGVGLALLTGKNVLALIAKVERSINRV